MNHQIRHSLSVSRDLAVGGNTTSRGLHISGNARIDGWLDAPNIKGPCKGLFPSAEALTSSYPDPKAGWWALVGDSFPVSIYRCDDFSWAPTGQISSEISIPLDHLADRMAELEERIRDIALTPPAADCSCDREETARISAHTVYRIDAPLSDDLTHARLSLYNEQDEVIASCLIPVGSGGSGGGTPGTPADATDIITTASVDHSVVKQGGSATLVYTYDQVYTSGTDTGESTGEKASVTVRLVRGEATVHQFTISNVSKGRHTMDLTPFLAPGNTDIYLTVQARDPVSGTIRTKQRHTCVWVSAISLTSDYDMAASIASGGYDGIAEIPFTITGAGTKSVVLWLDGEQRDVRTITGDTSRTGTFMVDTSSLTPGRHSLQLRGQTTITDNEGLQVTLFTDTIHIDILRRGADTPFAGIMYTDPSGTVTPAGATTVLDVEMYSLFTMQYVVYDPAATLASATITAGGSSIEVIARRTVHTYSTRFTHEGAASVAISVGAATTELGVNVLPGRAAVTAVTDSIRLNLTAAGRSNNEAQPATWECEGATTRFEGVDWSTSGWTGESLRLINGAKAVVEHCLFDSDIKDTGYTFEVELHVDNITDPQAPVVSCLDSGKGLCITGDEIKFLTGASVQYTDEDGLPRQRELKLATNYVSGCTAEGKRWIRIAHTVWPQSRKCLMELYADGNRVGADNYDRSFTFRHTDPQPITIDSAGADVEVRMLRVYCRALTDDEILGNAVAESADTATIAERCEDNDVLGEDGEVDMQKLSDRGKGIIRIIHANTDTEKGPGPLDDVFATNNKKTDFTADVYYYPSVAAREAGARPFVAQDCYIRIQGTSSTKYPSKNIRIYLSKGTPSLRLSVGGEVAAAKEYALRSGTPAQSVLCAKTDYSDSSMSLNTGGAKLFNDVFKELGLLTPPQRHQHAAEGGAGAVSARAAIDGWPVDVFAAHILEGQNTYYGQYNLNNEKSKSARVFGMQGVEGFEPACPMALEMLNNSEPLCLYQCEGDTPAQVEQWLGESGENGVTHFDAGAEVNYSLSGSDGDVKWAQLSTAERAAVARLWHWIRQCVPAGADPADIASWRSQKFIDEATDYFDVDYLLTYYIWTDYFLAVDQRAKNIMLRTWDGQKWYPTYYDGDTQMGKSNDSFMSYPYSTGRDYWDARLSKYAFEGRDSWLWCLVLANMEERLKACAATLRSVLTNDRVLRMLNDEQAGNWSDRVYNKSGYIKYIQPALEPRYGKTWQFIYALQGKNRPHREYFIRNRFAVLDARYCCGGFRDDNIDFYLQQGAEGQAGESVFGIVPSEAYAFGYSTNNPGLANTVLGDTGVVEPPSCATITISGRYGANDPLRLYGASRIAELDCRGACSTLKNGFDLSNCSALRKLDMSVPAGSRPSTGWWVDLGACSQLRHIDLRGQSNARTGGATSTALDFSAQSKLEYLDARGTGALSIRICPGAPVHTLFTPESLESLSLEHLPALRLGSGQGPGLEIADMASLRHITLTGCTLLEQSSMLLVNLWLQQKTTPHSGCSLDISGVNWTLADSSMLEQLLQLGSLHIAGRIHIEKAVTPHFIERCKEVLGDDCFIPGSELHISYTDLVVLDDDTLNPAFFACARKAGWCSDEHVMARHEAEAVTNNMLDTSRKVGDEWVMQRNTSIETMDEFGFFTGVTEVPVSFMNCYGTNEADRCLRRVTIPPNVQRLMGAAFYGNIRLERITMLPMTAPVFQSDVFRDIGLQLPEGTPKILEIPRGSTGYVGADNTPVYTALQGYTIAYID